MIAAWIRAYDLARTGSLVSIWSGCLNRDARTWPYLVSCQGVARLGVLGPGFARGGPTKVGACKSILFTESYSVVEIKNTWMI